MKKKVLEKYIINKNINYLKKNYYIYNIFSNFDFVKKISKKDYDKLCQQLITLNFNNIPTIKFYYEQQFFKKKSINLIRYFFINKIKLKKNDKNLIITNLLEINYQLQEKYQFDSQLFQHEEMPFDSYQLGLKKLKNPYIYYPENNINELLKNKKKIYDVIILRNNELNASTYYHYFLLAKIPNLILLVTSALQQLKKGGTIYIFLRNGQINNSIKKLFYLLTNSFNSFEIHKIKSNLVYFIEFKDFKDNVSDETLEKLRKICLKTRPYNYSLCQFLHYYYHLLKTDSSALGYELDLNEVGISTKYKSEQTNMEIIDDINIDPKITKEGEFLVYQIEKMYQEFDETTRFNILRNVHYKDLDDYQTIYVDQDLVNKVYYENTIQLIKYFEENKIPYNKTYLAYINKYNTNQLKKLYSLDNIIDIKIINYNFKKKLTKKKISSTKRKSSKKKKKSISLDIKQSNGYHYPELNNTQELSYLGYKVKEGLLEDTKHNKLPSIIKKTTEDFARGVSQFVNSKFNIRLSVSNAYMKLWEIYASVPQIIPYKEEINSFHFCEAPGNWINCTSKYIESKRRRTDSYKWYANTLNPKHPSNIKEFGKNIFSDDYGFMKKYADKWLYGDDDTGDITKPKNLRWLRDYFSDKPKMDIVTGDGGIGGDLKKLQKLEYAQMCAAIGTCGVGGSCVVKHFLPYVQDLPESKEASGFFMNFLYIYYLFFKEIHLMKPLSSSPNSSEFYLVGLKFRGIEDDEFEKVIGMLDKFEINQCIFKESNIPTEFSNQVIVFIEKLSQLNIEQYDIVNTLLTCHLNKDTTIEKVTGCKNYLNPKFIQELQAPRFRQWIKLNKFEM